MLVLGVALGVLLALPASAQEGKEVPVTIKELDLSGAIREFQDFQTRLGEFHERIGKGRQIARETAEILEDLREKASPENEYNEGPILDAVTGYVDGVIQEQVGLVDFLESQRYRITYYANQMASSVRPADLAPLFGTQEQNEVAITVRAREIGESRSAIADFIDRLPEDQFDRASFRSTRSMPPETRQQLDVLLYRYQQEKSAMELAKKRLQLVRSAGRAGPAGAPAPEVDADLLVGQMFGALDQIRLQMSMDLLYLEHLLQGYSQSTRTQEILSAFQSLVELQGDLEGPSPELSSVLDWLQDSSTRRITLNASSLSSQNFDIPRASDLLREAYEGARKTPQ
jgi:hypothetical protein